MNICGIPGGASSGPLATSVNYPVHKQRSAISQRFDIQAQQYAFPYHYLPTVDESGLVGIFRSLKWGMEYLTYMTFVRDYIVQELRAGSVLDVGCGDGRLSDMLHGKVERVVGCDLAEQAILFARAFNPDLEFYLDDVKNVPGQFDVTTLIEVMEHIPDEQYPEFVEKVAAKTKPDGRLIVSVPTTNLPLNKKHFRHYTLDLLRQQLAPSFEIERHWFLVKQGGVLTCLRLMLQNRAVIVMVGPWRRLVWRLHKRWSYMADAQNGEHLVVVARRAR